VVILTVPIIGFLFLFYISLRVLHLEYLMNLVLVDMLNIDFQDK